MFKKLRLSPSIVVSFTALLIALGGAGYSATGGNFILGQFNTATTPTGLSAPINSYALGIQNTSSGAGATALALAVAAGRPPIVTNSNTRVANLNADLVDGLDSTEFVREPFEAEGWHYIGDPGEPAFENGWVNFDNTTSHAAAIFQHAGYRIDANGIVHLRGLVKNGTLGHPFFRLPGPYCPWYEKVFPAISNNAFARVTVQYSNGVGTCAVFSQVGSNAWISLEGVSYPRFDLDRRVFVNPAEASTAAEQEFTGRRGPAPRL